MRRVALLCFLGTLGVSSSAFGDAASPTEVALDWLAPPGCPAQEVIVADVRRILGGDTSHRVTAHAEVEQLAPDRWRVRLSTDVDGVAGERSLEADSCASLADAAALILAWTIDPERSRAVEAQTATSAVAAVSVPLVSPPAPIPRHPFPPSSPPPLPVSTSPGAGNRASPPPGRELGHGLAVQGLLALSGTGDFGVLPEPGPGVELALGLTAGSFRGELLGSDWLDQEPTTITPAGKTEGTDLHFLEAAARGCFRVPISGQTFEIDPCAGVGVVNVSSTGAQEDKTATHSHAWPLLHGDVLASWIFVPRFALRATLGVVVPLEHPQFVIDDPQGVPEAQ